MPKKPMYPIIDGVKKCSKCLEPKQVGEFYKSADSGSGIMPSCKACVKAAVRAYEKKNPEKRLYSVMRKYYHKSNYGLEHGGYEKMLERQNFSCAICKSKSSKRKDQYFHIDHCHTTGKIRGLLCHPCNMAIGFLCDDPNLCRAAAEYLI